MAHLKAFFDFLVLVTLGTFFSPFLLEIMSNHTTFQSFSLPKQGMKIVTFLSLTESRPKSQLQEVGS